MAFCEVAPRTGVHQAEDMVEVKKKCSLELIFNFWVVFEVSSAVKIDWDLFNL